jgi:hypothetical protein
MAGFAGTDQAGSFDEFLARCLGTGSPFGPVRRIERTRLMSAGAHELVAVVRRGVLSARRVRARGPPPRLETSLAQPACGSGSCWGRSNSSGGVEIKG